MSELVVRSRKVGEVFVDGGHLDQLGNDLIGAAIDHLRLGGGRCWVCQRTIRPSDDVSLVVDQTSAGARLGFLHYRCGPPQLHDRRRDRRAAIAMARYLKNRAAEVQAFALFRSYPFPRAVLVVSQEAAVPARTENWELTNPWLALNLEMGLTLVAPQVEDASPDEVEGWTLRIEGSKVVCETPRGALYDGPLDLPGPWLSALANERRCLVLVAGQGIDSNVLEGGSVPALNLLAGRGMLAGGTVGVAGVLGIHAALGLEVALEEAKALKALTARPPQLGH